MTHEHKPSEHMSDIKVSIIVPVYNVELYIKDCMESLIHQTLKDIEIILIDDASTDGSGTICDEYALSDPRVSVVHHMQNMRQGKSRNEGIALARGEYIGFVDPDDWLDLDFYEKLYKAAKKNQAQIAKAVIKKTNESRDVISISKLNNWIYSEYKRDKKLFHVFTYEHTSAIYKSDFLSKYRIQYADIRNGEDGIFLLQATFFCTNFIVVKNTFYNYRYRATSTVAIKELEYYQSFLDYFDLYIDFINSHKMSEESYKYAFYNGVYAMRNRYTELDRSGNYPEFSKIFIAHVFRKVQNCKLGGLYLLENFFPYVPLKKQIFLLIKDLLKRMD